MTERTILNPMYATVKINNVEDTIEHHIQMSKRFVNHLDMKFLDLQDKEPDYFIVRNTKLPIEYFEEYKDFLWYKYLNQNKENFIEKIIELENIKDKDFLKLLKQEDRLPVLDKNILNSMQDIIIQEVNCSGICTNNIYEKVVKLYPFVKTEYTNICHSVPKEMLMGECLFLECENKIIASIFSQKEYLYRITHIDLSAFKKGLFKIKDFAINNKMSVAIPFGIGCNNDLKEWNIIKNIILEVFNDYPIISYKEKN